MQCYNATCIKKLVLQCKFIASYSFMLASKRVGTNPIEQKPLLSVSKLTQE